VHKLIFLTRMYRDVRATKRKKTDFSVTEKKWVCGIPGTMRMHFAKFRLGGPSSRRKKKF